MPDPAKMADLIDAVSAVPREYAQPLHEFYGYILDQARGSNDALMHRCALLQKELYDKVWRHNA